MNWILNLTFFCCLSFCFACKHSEQQVKHLDQKDRVASIPIQKPIDLSPSLDALLKHPVGEPDPDNKPYFHLNESLIDDHVYYIDTIEVGSAEELVSNIKSNRVLKLIKPTYELSSTLKIDGVKNLKIVSETKSEIFVAGTEVAVLNLSNTYNIDLDGLVLGKADGSGYVGQQSILTLAYAYNIHVSNTRLIGNGTYGLNTYGVYNLNMIDSEISDCTIFIFDIERSREINFKNTVFRNNHLAVSVLGGFSNASRAVSFVNCAFLYNLPESPGNPAFNQRDLYFPVLFRQCIFKNNVGFKWYDDHIKLEDCSLEDSGFIGI